ncbi:hypothetical protein Nepgr_027244 [Nepenthes gracilis]|uniref:Uncharacterized protein n=1 Tax=Nepenthes gracilis TaxID=150966 RepID=A0AAD3TB14_NEPGR|nr:hypothetical protein Nepgr_027244 [Nepenthes gracilis]
MPKRRSEEIGRIQQRSTKPGELLQLQPTSQYQKETATIQIRPLHKIEIGRMQLQASWRQQTGRILSKFPVGSLPLNLGPSLVGGLDVGVSPLGSSSPPRLNVPCTSSVKSPVSSAPTIPPASCGALPFCPEVPKNSLVATHPHGAGADNHGVSCILDWMLLWPFFEELDWNLLHPAAERVVDDVQSSWMMLLLNEWACALLRGAFGARAVEWC